MYTRFETFSLSRSFFSREKGEETKISIPPRSVERTRAFVLSRVAGSIQRGKSRDYIKVRLQLHARSSIRARRCHFGNRFAAARKVKREKIYFVRCVARTALAAAFSASRCITVLYDVAMSASRELLRELACICYSPCKDTQVSLREQKVPV